MEGNIIGVNGPVIKAEHMKGFKMREMVMVGERKLIGEIIILEEDFATIQVYEETSGLKIGESVISTGSPLSLKLGPGILGNIFDGIERPLEKINEMSCGFLPEGIGLISLDEEKLWDVDIIAKIGDELKEGQIYANVQETASIMHKIMVPPGVFGTVTWAFENGKYNIETVVVKLKQGAKEYELKLYQYWPCRTPRPVKDKKTIFKPLITGQRIIDIFFPLAKGGTCAIPGGFGTGKTIKIGRAHV